MQDILEKPLNFMHCVASSFGYPNYRLSEKSLVPISSDNRRSTVVISKIRNLYGDALKTKLNFPLGIRIDKYVSYDEYLNIQTITQCGRNIPVSSSVLRVLLPILYHCSKKSVLYLENRATRKLKRGATEIVKIVIRHVQYSFQTP